MRVIRGAVACYPVGGQVIAVNKGELSLSLTLDEARWLMLNGLATVIANHPGEPPVKVRDASNDEGQIKGQLALDAK